MNTGKKVIYTCITGNYDQPLKYEYMDRDYCYVCFVDDVSQFSNPLWEFRPLQFDELDNTRNARWHKLHPDILFPEIDESIWIDGNINITSPEFFTKMKPLGQGEAMRVARHPERNNLDAEYDANRGLSKDDRALLDLEQEEIHRRGFDGIYYGDRFFETNVMLRRHHLQQCVDAMSEWWWWVDHYSFRDQLSFTYVLWKHGLDVGYLFEDNLRECSFVRFESPRHMSLSAMDWLIDVQRRGIRDRDAEIRLLKSMLKDVNQSWSFKAGRAITAPLRLGRDLLGHRQ